MNWYKLSQKKQQWSWRRFWTTFGATTILGLASFHGLGVVDIQRAFAQDPQKVIQLTENYQKSQAQNTSNNISQQSAPINNNEQPVVEEAPINNIQENQTKPDLNNNFSKDILDMVARHEGKSNTVYFDSKKIPTIGIGFNLQKSDAEERLEAVGANLQDVLNGKPLTDDQINKLFLEDMEIAKDDAKNIFPNFDKLPTTVQNILVNMSFNMGADTLDDFVNFRRAILNNNYQEAARRMEKSKWYKQVGNRSKELVNMMKNTK